MTNAADEVQRYPLKERARRFYRGTLFQAIVLGLVSFTQPGIWGALNNLGAGGQAEPYVVNAANVVTFAIMVVFAPLFGILGNIYGMRWVLVFGTLGYAPYSAALYCNSVYGTQWFLIFGAATCGLSASALWTSEAAIAVGYPEPARRGLYIAIWLAINKIGSVIAGAIQLAINANINSKGSIAPSTYLVLVALQCLGPLLALLISPPEKVLRADGTKVIFGGSNRTFRSELKALGRVFQRKEILLLLPVFISSQWGQTYNGNFLAAYFTVRARALMAFVVAIMGMFLNMATGGLLDVRRYRRSVKARVSWLLIGTLFSAMWIWNILLQIDYASRSVSLDWNSVGFHTGAASYVFFRINYEMIGVWAYWILGSYDSHSDTLALTTGVLRSCESLGSTFSYAVGSTKNASLLVNLLVAAVVFWASVPTSTWASWIVPDVPKGEAESDDEENAPQVERVTITEKA
ncbi:hypothetical protein BP6252_01933 [Coleophoma cylindrospora]|uniref:Uncharacterized protein n=1 Tax=Coleophoma cylindrospora TaxID=1849047 RepID=A0A3D8SDG0_9HELO|nr:hypothetical protein BP6252_01933 [Coleophoma cylindrospora]